MTTMDERVEQDEIDRIRLMTLMETYADEVAVEVVTEWEALDPSQRRAWMTEKIRRIIAGQVRANVSQRVRDLEAREQAVAKAEPKIAAKLAKAQAHEERVEQLVLDLERELGLVRAEATIAVLGHQAGVVYYLRRADGRIKIGTTNRAWQRVKQLWVEHGPLEILAIEPGSYATERARHRAFADERGSTRDEWFEPSERLMAHIAQVDGQYRELRGLVENELL